MPARLRCRSAMTQRSTAGTSAQFERSVCRQSRPVLVPGHDLHIGPHSGRTSVSARSAATGALSIRSSPHAWSQGSPVVISSDLARSDVRGHGPGLIETYVQEQGQEKNLDDSASPPCGTRFRRRRWTAASPYNVKIGGWTHDAAGNRWSQAVCFEAACHQVN